MEQSNSKISEVMKMHLDENTPTIPFRSIWQKHNNNSSKNRGLRKLIFIPSITMIALFAFVLVGFKLAAIEDKTDYPFIDDSQVIGKWQGVDLVESTDQFTPGKKVWDGDLFISELAFVKEGQMLVALNEGNCKLGPAPFIWTQGIVINEQEKTASKYEIKDINGSTYMFFEWKSGDYTYWHQKPPYYVLKKVDNLDYSDYKLTAIEDKVDYPFVDDPQLIGQWNSVDFVETIDEFKPKMSIWPGKLFLTEFNISENGKIIGLTSEGQFPEDFLTWTNGLILDKQNKLASKYVIKEIKGDTYLFYEWKSGDYAYRGIEPHYYVLKKAK